MDAIAALSIILIAFSLIMGISPEKTYQNTEYQQMHYLADDAIQVFSNTKFYSINQTLKDEILANTNVSSEDLNKSIVDVVGLLWSLNETGYAANITRDFFAPLLYGMNYSLKISEYGNGSLIYSSTGGFSDQEEMTRHTSVFRIISGYKENSPFTGFVARAFAAGAAKRTQSYVYFGGFEGNGNITKILTLPSVIDTINETYMEMDTAANFTLYINGEPSGTYNVSKRVSLRAKNWTVPSQYNANFVPGINNITLSFPDINYAYVGGGFIRVKYNTTQMDTTEIKMNADGNVTERYYFPGIDGVINIYSSFYVPGALKSLGIQLHYLSNYTVYLIVGNTSVYENNTNTSQVVYLNNSYLRSILNYTKFNQTMPIRLGTKNVSGLNDGSDVVLITDLSGSMGYWMLSGSTNGINRACDDPLLSATNTSRISVAKCVDTDFVNTILKNDGQKVGLTAYSEKIIDSGTLDLTDNATKLNAVIYTYLKSGNTCISCGIENATDKLSLSLNSTAIIPDKSQWYYNDSLGSAAPLDDSGGRNWTNINYSTGILWSLDYAPFENASKVPSTIIQLQDAGTQNLADAYVSSNNPTTNYGSNTQLLVYSDGSKRTYLKFNISFVPAKQIISLATLYLYQSSNSFGDNISVFHVNDTTWAKQTESTINWNNQPCGINFNNVTNCNLTAESKVLVNSQNAWFAWNVTQMVNKSYNKGDLNVSMVLNLSTSAGGKTESFRSKDYNSDTTKRPYLNITYKEASTSVNSTSGSIYFRKNFTIGDMKLAKKGILKIMSANATEVYLNGILVFSDIGSSHNATYWNSVSIINSKYFVKGDNIIAVKLYNTGGSPRFDLSLVGLNDSRNKAMLVMSDGEANECYPPVWDCPDSQAKQQTIDFACNAYEKYGIVSHAVGFSDDVDTATLQAVATCGHGNFYSSNNADELKQIYLDIANSIISYSTQAAEISGDTAIARLFTDSFIEYNYTPAININYGNISLTLESNNFANTSGNISIESPKNGSYFIAPSAVVVDAKATSYSSDYWTNVMDVKSASTPWKNAYSLNVFGTNYISLGDPYIVNIPVSYIVPGETNYVRINTARNTTELEGGSPDNKIIYSIKVKGGVDYGNTFPSLKNATDDAKSRLSDYMASFGVSLTEIEVSSQDVGKIPWMWGPAILTLEVWK